MTLLSRARAPAGLQIRRVSRRWEGKDRPDELAPFGDETRESVDYSESPSKQSPRHLTGELEGLAIHYNPSPSQIQNLNLNVGIARRV